MGCICSRSSAVEDSPEGIANKFSSYGTRLSELSFPRSNSEKKVDVVRVKDRSLESRSSDVNLSLVNKKGNGSAKLYDDDENGMNKIEKPELAVFDQPSFGRVPKAVEGEQVAAGWPYWLSSVASEAIEGWVPRSASSFERLHKIGQGTYSTVYKAHDLTNQKIVALKRVRFHNHDPESVKFMAREIHILRRLDHPNIIKLEGLITSSVSHSLYLVFEYMEHDLTGLASNPTIKFSEPQLKCYMHQLLSGLDHCHSHGVLHRDIKGSNLLIDNNGVLKIADFGLASYFDPHHTVPLTSRVVTLWYRPPELLLGANHYGVAVDLWSAGCILGELYSGRPILPGKTEVEQLHRIFKLCGSPSEDYWHKLWLPHLTTFKPANNYKRCVAEVFREYPSPAVKLIATLLSIDPALRGTAASALKSEFFTSEPMACDPSSLPKYPPSKEMDTRLQHEATRREGAVGGEKQKVGSGVRQEKGHRAHVTAADPGMAPQQSELRKLHREPVSGFRFFPPHKQSDDVKETGDNLPRHLRKRSSHSGPLVPGYRWAKSGKEVDDGDPVSNKANLSKLYGRTPSKPMSSQDEEETPVQLHHGKPIEVIKSLESTSGSDSKRIVDLTQIDNGGVPSEKLTPAFEEKNVVRKNKIYMSGPLLVQANNMDVMLKEHEQKIQEFSRKAIIDKARARSDKLYNPYPKYL